MAVTTSGKDKQLRFARLFVGGYDLSGDSRTVSSLDNTWTGVDFTGWSETVKNFLAGEREVGVKGYQAFINDAAGRAFTILKDADNTSRLAFCFGGGGEPATGDPCYLLPSVQMNDNAGFNAGAGVFNADFLLDGSQRTSLTDNPNGVVLQAATAITVTTTSSSHDNAASSANGWHAQIHIIATVAGNFAFTIEHSANDSAWATLGTFVTTGGSVGSELLTGSGTVNRYLRAVSTRTAGTVTVLIAIARN